MAGQSVGSRPDSFLDERHQSRPEFIDCYHPRRARWRSPKNFLNLEALFTEPLEQVFRQLIVDTLIILAIVEVFKTTVTYFSEGRVKVTFIVDTILVVMLTEIISKWFSEAHLEQWMILGGILVVLAIIRVIAVQWSPTRAENAPEWTTTPKSH